MSEEGLIYSILFEKHIIGIHVIPGVRGIE